MVPQESAEILRWLPTAFNDLISPDHAKLDLYPSHLRSEIDAISEWMQRDLNTGVYKAGFAPSQEVYDKNLPAVFASLNKLEEIVHKNGGPYLLGKELTELDLRAYATIVRFDTVYVQHFKCNLGTIRHDYPVLNNWLRNLYWNVEGFKESTDFKHIKENVSSIFRACAKISGSSCEKSGFSAALADQDCAPSIPRATTTSIPRPSLPWVLTRTSRKVSKTSAS